MATSFKLDGMTELRAALRNLPEDLASEADGIVHTTAEKAAREIQAAYPEGPTGNLRRGVTVRQEFSKFGASAQVRSRARHASLFEFGTKRRQTRSGANRGAMPKAPAGEAMIPIAQKARAQMYRALIALVERAGFTVTRG